MTSVIQLLANLSLEEDKEIKIKIKEEILLNLEETEILAKKVFAILNILTLEGDNLKDNIWINKINELGWMQDNNVKNAFIRLKNPYNLYQVVNCWEEVFNDNEKCLINFNICDMLFKNGNFHKYYKYITDDMINMIKNHRNEDGENVLMLLLKENPEYNYVKKMIDLGVATNFKNNDGLGVFDYIGNLETSKEHLEIVNFLLDKIPEVELSEKEIKKNIKNKCYEWIIATEREKNLNVEIKKIKKLKREKSKNKI